MQELITVAGLYTILTIADILGTYLKKKDNERLVYFLSSQMGTIFYTTFMFVLMLILREFA